MSGLTEQGAAGHPIDQFQIWFDEALTADVPEPAAMTLATATPDGEPDARTVLLRGVDKRGFVFFTNYDSHKGLQLAANDRVALVVLWAPLHYQVRVKGRAERASAEESDAYFASRPRGSQLGAWASPQSQVLASRDALEQRLARAQERFPGEVPRPSHWGGYRVAPQVVEFWQGRPDRLHDRLRYRRAGDGWALDRLAP